MGGLGALFRPTRGNSQCNFPRRDQNYAPHYPHYPHRLIIMFFTLSEMDVFYFSPHLIRTRIPEIQ